MRHASLALTSVLAVGVLCAQEPTLRFEVASVRPQTVPRTAAEVTGWIRPAPGGRLAGTHSRLIYLMTYAYDIKEFQVIGPDWIRSTYYAVEAKAASHVPVAQLRVMLRSLLEERFGLTAHHEQREMPYQALVPARADRQPGPRLVRIEDEACDPRPPDVEALLRDRLPRPAVTSRNRIAGVCAEIRDLAEQLSAALGTLVVDETGLGRGRWVFEAPHGALPRLGAGPTVRPESGTLPPDGELPSYLDALRDQLGLRLKPARGPVDVLVIDSVSEPTEN